jgi:YfiH family protein
MPEVRRPDAFEWIRCPWGDALRCRPLEAVADHLFTTRQPVIPRAGFSPGDGWHRLALTLGVPAGALVRMRQVHGTRALTLRRGDPPAADWGTGDIAVTDRPDLALSVSVADCVPILLADRRSGAVAAAHAGWRGTAAGVAGAAVQALVSAFGADPANLVAAIGPSIGPCCYRVGHDVRDVFSGAGLWTSWMDRWFATSPAGSPLHGVPGTDPGQEGRASLFLDTWTANADQLSAAGVPATQVHLAGLCTSCHRDLFHSYRVDGEHAGRMVGVIRRR